MNDDDRCRAVFHHRCTKRAGHGGAHESGDSAELVAEVERLREALQDIADDLGHPGDPAWRCAMEALGLDADGALRAWHD